MDYIQQIENKIQELLPEEEYNIARKVAAKVKAIAKLPAYKDICNPDYAYLIGLLYESRKFIHLIDIDMPLEVCEAIGILNYEKEEILHNFLNVLETKNCYPMIVRSAEMVVLNNEMD